jgi:hypothetical protein
MDSGVPSNPSFIATPPMMFTHFMGANPSTFYKCMQSYGTQSAPWGSSHFPVDMSSPFQTSPSSTYMNPSNGSRGTMALMPTSSFYMSHVPQPTFTVGGWNLPSYRSSPIYALSGANTQMGSYSTYHTPSLYPSSAMTVPLNTFPMESPTISPSLSYGENQFYGSGYPLHGTPSQGGNIYPHLNDPYHILVSS